MEGFCFAQEGFENIAFPLVAVDASKQVDEIAQRGSRLIGKKCRQRPFSGCCNFRFSCHGKVFGKTGFKWKCPSDAGEEAINRSHTQASELGNKFYQHAPALSGIEVFEFFILFELRKLFGIQGS